MAKALNVIIINTVGSIQWSISNTFQPMTTWQTSLIWKSLEIHELKHETIVIFEFISLSSASLNQSKTVQFCVLSHWLPNGKVHAT